MQTQDKHTPGPWKIGISIFGDRTFYGVFPEPTLKPGKCEVVLTTPIVPKCEFLTKADAFLIASAPELFEACKVALDAIGYVSVMSNSGIGKIEAAEKLLKDVIEMVEPTR